MSWCRWSSNDFDCDIYAWDDVSGGTVVCVAGSRHVFDRSSLPPTGPLFSPEWLARQWALSEALDGAEMVSIGLPHDGEHRTFATSAEAADWVDELADLGYRVPDGVTDAMRSPDLIGEGTQ